MIVLSNATAVGLGIKTPFVGSGGTGPYTYSVLPGGVGGTINSEGLYTAPFAKGTDIIQAEDALGETATKDIAVLYPLGLLCDVIKSELNLASDQVYIYNQKFAIPPDNRLYIAVEVGTVKPFSNVIRPAENGAGLDAEQYANFVSSHDINIMSSSDEALNRKEEVLMSFVSHYSQRQQAANSFHIAPLSSQFNNLSDLEGELIPYRFNISINLSYMTRKVQSTEFFENFNEPNVITDK